MPSYRFLVLGSDNDLNGYYDRRSWNEGWCNYWCYLCKKLVKCHLFSSSERICDNRSCSGQLVPLIPAELNDRPCLWCDRCRTHEFTYMTANARCDRCDNPMYQLRRIALCPSGQIDVLIEVSTLVDQLPPVTLIDNNLGRPMIPLIERIMQNRNNLPARSSSRRVIGAIPEGVIASIPIVKVLKSDCRDSTKCPVCQDKFLVGEDASELPCMHLYHPHCIARWLRHSALCPVCQRVITETSIIEHKRAHKIVLDIERELHKLSDLNKRERERVEEAEEHELERELHKRERERGRELVEEHELERELQHDNRSTLKQLPSAFKWGKWLGLILFLGVIYDKFRKI
ncbi:unnamed protein product [Cuscuta epithymum]|uniref:RING-type domain-containing protein n=1 Tax=Cuscuta epithymum TaxID=186058 RepID=A0AAV0F5V7_9ASTE|nr:unnamed protein product [Cuscuta epithymum]